MTRDRSTGGVRSSRCRIFQFITSLVWLLSGLPSQADLLPRAPYTPDPAQVAHLQRTITLLKSATPTNKPTLRVLVYGNSHATQPWWRLFMDELRAKHPNVNFVVTNRAWVAFDAFKLGHTSLQDVGPWQPDLVLLTVGGNLSDYDPLYDRIRSSTTADVLTFPEHPMGPISLLEPSEFNEESEQNVWFMRYYVWLPEKANARDFCWANIRTPWKEYLLTYDLPTSVLLAADLYHTNEDGWRFLNDILHTYLAPRDFPSTLDPWNNARIQTRRVGTEVHWVGDTLDLRFVGNRVDVIYDETPPTDSPVYTYTIDNRQPRDLTELYGFEQSSSSYGVRYPMPGVLGIEHDAPLVEETWSLKVLSIDEAGYEVRYSVTGSKTGPDGEGSNLETFVSKSKRVRIEPDTVTAGWAFNVTSKRPPDDFAVVWNATRRSVDSFRPQASAQKGVESSQTLFVGTSETEHRLRIRPQQGTPKGIRAIRVYSPASLAQVVDANTQLSVERAGANVVIAWPSSSGTGTLESSESGINWAKVAGTPTESGGKYRVSQPTSSKVRYYRWRKP